MSGQSLIMDKQGVAHIVFNFMHEDIAPKDAAELYEFASQELKDSFIEGLTLGQTLILTHRQFMAKLSEGL